MTALRADNNALRLVLAAVFVFVMFSVIFFGAALLIRTAFKGAKEQAAYDRWCKERGAEVRHVKSKVYCHDRATGRTFDAPDAHVLLQELQLR
jgi:hypothetical protein